MADVTESELSEAIMKLGASTAADLGFFHRLPSGGGGSGAMMMSAHVVQDPVFPPGVGLFIYDYPVPMSAPAFIDVLILDPESPPSPTALNYEVNIQINTAERFGIMVTTSWNSPLNQDPLPDFDQMLGIRVETFAPTLSM